MMTRMLMTWLMHSEIRATRITDVERQSVDTAAFQATLLQSLLKHPDGDESYCNES